MSQRLLETDFPSGSRPQVKRSLSREQQQRSVRPVSTSGSMPKNLMMASSSSGGHAAASEWQYEPTFRTGSMSRVQTSFSVNPPQSASVGRTGSLRKAFTTSDEEEDLEEEEEVQPLTNQRPPPPVEHIQQKSKKKPHNNNSQSSTSDYHSDENPNLLPVEHRELPQFRLHQLQR